MTGFFPVARNDRHLLPDPTVLSTVRDVPHPTMSTATEPTPDDLYIAEDEREVGTMSPFFAAYRTEACEELYGWYCSHCDCLRTAMDTMGRIECSECSNRHKPREWDAAYL